MLYSISSYTLYIIVNFLIPILYINTLYIIVHILYILYIICTYFSHISIIGSDVHLYSYIFYTFFYISLFNLSEIVCVYVLRVCVGVCFKGGI